MTQVFTSSTVNPLRKREMTTRLLCLLVEADNPSEVVGNVKGVAGVYSAEIIPGTQLITVNVATQEPDTEARIAELPGVTAVSVTTGWRVRQRSSGT